jgi:DNA-directed RNA polymerase subunit RPC12/RpoP
MWSSTGGDMSDSACDLLVRGIAAAKAEEKDQARFYLEWVLRTDADRQQKIKAWLWLSEVSDDVSEKRDCLENILAHEPTNPLARRGLAILNGQLDPAEIIDPNRGPSAGAKTSPQPAKTKRFICQGCGGKMTFTPDGGSLTCAYCNRQLTLYQAVDEGAMVEEQDFAVALATAPGHARPVAIQSFSCQTCGVSFMLGSDVLSLTCPYCASAYVIKIFETRELVPPEGVIPFGLTQLGASSALQDWLEEKNLRFEVETNPPDGLYLPVWTFDVGGEVQWRGKVLERQYGWTNWVSQTGSHAIFYDDVLVPASHTLSADLTQEINHFQLDTLAPYDPGYLADWPAEVYQISVADASLAARRQAWERARRVVRTRVKIHQVRDLTLSSAGIVIESFKLILLPIWVGSYRYQDEDYKVVVNGQTGTVRAERPRGGLRKLLGDILGDG